MNGDEIYISTVGELAGAGLSTAPTGVYLIRDRKHHVRYVGQTRRSVQSRIRSHIFKIGFDLQWRVFVIPGGDNALEAALIKRYLPDFNTAHAIKLRRRTLEWKLNRALNECDFWRRLPDLRRRASLSVSQ